MRAGVSLRWHSCLTSNPSIPRDSPTLDNPAKKGRKTVDPAIAATLTTRWLAQADPSIRQGLLDACTLRHFVDGEMIYGFEQKQNCLWGVVSGSIRLFVAMSEQDPKLAHCAGPGFWFGAAPVITGGTRSMQAMAAGTCQALLD